MRGRFFLIALTVLSALAASLATSFAIEWGYQQVPANGQVVLEVIGLGALLIIPVVAFVYLLRRLRPGWIAAVLSALIFFPFMLVMEFWLLVITGLSDTP